jgi:hypothetical protein
MHQTIGASDKNGSHRKYVYQLLKWSGEIGERCKPKMV